MSCRVVFAVLAASIFASNFALSASPQWVRGSGVARESEQTCLEDLPQFKKRLKILGLYFRDQDVECKEVDEEPDTYAPVFKVIATRPTVAETAVAIYTPTRGQCEKTLKALGRVVADADERIVESGCARLRVVDTSSGEAIEQFQPMVVLLR